MSATPHLRLSDTQRAALVRLLSDDDPEVFRFIHDTILSQGPLAREWLTPYQLSLDPRMRRRVRGILNRLDRQDADTAFLSFCLSRGDYLDIEEGVLLLARTAYPDLNLDGYRAILDEHASLAREKTHGLSHPHRILGIINRLLFDQLGYQGNSDQYYDPENSYLNRVIDRRAGNPISLCCVYLLVSARLGLPVVGVGLPGHFLCRYQTASHEIYIDAFNGGRFMSRTDCIHYLVRTNCSLREDYLGPIKPRQMLLRIINNLHQIYQQQNQREAAQRMRGYLLALAKASPQTGPVIT